MTDHRGYGYPPAIGYGAYVLVRGLLSAIAESAQARKQAPVMGLPAAGVPLTKPPSPPPHLTAPSPPLFSPPVVQWHEPRELLAWRAWRLGFLLRCRGGDGGPRLLSLAASCIWNGPVARDGVPLAETRYPSGIYALKLDVADQIQWHNEHCWVTGTIALSGRVVEHALGYRAERAVVRELRLGVGAHLALRSLKQLRETIDALENRYQVAVQIGQAEREIADRMLHGGHKACKLPFVWDRPPWRVI